MEKNIEKEIKFTAEEELQAKLLAELRQNDTDEFVRRIKGIFRFGDFTIDAVGTEVFEDEYFDTKSRALNDLGSYLRVRHQRGAAELTVKQPRSIKAGHFSRDEHTTDLTPAEYEALRSSTFASVVKTYFPELTPEILQPILNVKNKRLKFNLVRKDEQYEMSFDTYRYYFHATGEETADMFEIEIEAKNDSARRSLDSIRRHLADAVAGVTFSTASKYARGLHRLAIRAEAASDKTPEPPASPRSADQWQPKAGFYAGLATLAYFMLLIAWSAVVRPIPCEARPLVIMVLALGLALASWFFGRDAAVKGTLPLPKGGKPVQFVALGGVAVFLLVLLVAYLVYVERCP